MAREHNRNDASHPRGMSRRKFIKLAAMAGLLAGCRPLKEVVTPVLSEVEGPTSTPPPTPTPAPIATPTVTIRRPEIIKFYPDVPSKIVHTHHAGAWDSDALVPEAIRQMLDTSITELTGLDDAGEAWASLFDPGERVAIKVNAFRNSIIWTHVPLVMAVTECLQEVASRLNKSLSSITTPVNWRRRAIRSTRTGLACAAMAPTATMESFKNDFGVWAVFSQGKVRSYL